MIGDDAPILGDDDIEAAIYAVDHYVWPGGRLVSVCLTLNNGMQVTGSWAVLTPEQLQLDVAIAHARRHAKRQARDLLLALQFEQLYGQSTI